MGIWTNWKACWNHGGGQQGDNRCGIGITNRTQYCPRLDAEKNMVDVTQLANIEAKTKEDGFDRTKLSAREREYLQAQPNAIDNLTHVCTDRYISDPSVFCMVAFCDQIPYLNDEIGSKVYGRRWLGMNGSKAVDEHQNEILTYHYNARTAYRPARKSFADPFVLHPNINTSIIDIDFIKTKLKQYQSSILSRYKGDTMTNNLVESFSIRSKESK